MVYSSSWSFFSGLSNAWMLFGCCSTDEIRFYIFLFFRRLLLLYYSNASGEILSSADPGPSMLDISYREGSSSFNENPNTSEFYC